MKINYFVVLTVITLFGTLLFADRLFAQQQSPIDLTEAMDVLQDYAKTTRDKNSLMLLAAQWRTHGIGYSNPSDALRSHLSIPENKGRIIDYIEDGSIGSEMGFEVGDIILEINKEEVEHDTNVGMRMVAVSLKNAVKKKKQFPVLVIRKGKKLELVVSSESIAKTNKNYRIGIRVDPVNELFKSQLGLAENEGLAITSVTEKSAAEVAGLQVNDVLISCNEKPLGDFESLRNAIQSSKGKEIEFEVLTKGVRKSLKIVPVADAPVDEQTKLMNAIRIARNSPPIGTKFLTQPLFPVVGPLESQNSFRYVIPRKTETPHTILLQRNQKTDSAAQSAAIDEIMQELDALKEKLESLRTKID